MSTSNIIKVPITKEVKYGEDIVTFVDVPSEYRKLYIDNLNTDKTLHASSNKSCNHNTIYRIIFLIILVSVITIYLSKLLTTKGIFAADDPDIEHTKNDTHTKEVLNRQSSRGALASVATTVFMLVMNIVMDGWIKVDGGTSSALVGLLLGSIIGFIIDQLIGTDTGLALCKRNPKDGLNYAYGSMFTSMFGRYIITVFFDMFISLVLFNLSFKYVKTIPFFRCPGNFFIANGILSAFIGLVTFYTFTNKTRFLYAYPSDPDTTNRIQSTMFFLITTVAGLIFIITPADSPTGVGHPLVKILLLGIAMAIMLALSISDTADYLPMNTEKTGDEKEYKQVIKKATGGKVILLLVTIITLFYTTSKSAKRIKFNTASSFPFNTRVSYTKGNNWVFIIPIVFTIIITLCIALPAVLPDNKTEETK
jgi:hypothetical protein